eukprot:1184761-Prorocentrum_minimum.AAC.4
MAICQLITALSHGRAHPRRYGTHDKCIPFQQTTTTAVPRGVPICKSAARRRTRALCGKTRKGCARGIRLVKDRGECRSAPATACCGVCEDGQSRVLVCHLNPAPAHRPVCCRRKRRESRRRNQRRPPRPKRYAPLRINSRLQRQLAPTASPCGRTKSLTCERGGALRNTALSREKPIIRCDDTLRPKTSCKSALLTWRLSAFGPADVASLRFRPC